MIPGHGDDIYINGRDIKANFSSNVYRHINHSGLFRHLQDSFPKINSYPEPDSGTLANLIAEKTGTRRESIIVTNGATEAIYLVASTFRGKQSAILSPTFAEYNDACTLYEHRVRLIDSLSGITNEDEILWICNPNNPTGTVIPATDLQNLICEIKDKIIVIDQSYGELTKDATLPISTVNKDNNLIIIKSLTKEYGIPGLRVGYIASDKRLCSMINTRCLPWSVNILASEAAKFLITKGDPGFNIYALLEETQRFMREIADIPGFLTFDTRTNYFLCKHDSTKASELKEWLLAEHGLLIRDASNFRGLDDKYFRIAAQLPEENNLLINALKCWKSVNI